MCITNAIVLVLPAPRICVVLGNTDAGSVWSPRQRAFGNVAATTVGLELDRLYAYYGPGAGGNVETEAAKNQSVCGCSLRCVVTDVARMIGSGLCIGTVINREHTRSIGSETYGPNRTCYTLTSSLCTTGPYPQAQFRRRLGAVAGRPVLDQPLRQKHNAWLVSPCMYVRYSIWVIETNSLSRGVR